MSCRACAGNDRNTEPVDAELYFYCTSVKMSPDDGLPANVCRICMDLLETLCRFKRQCIRADAALKRALKPTEPESAFPNAQNDAEKSEPEPAQNKSKKVTKKTNTMLYCQKCDKSFFKYVKLEAHMRKHFGMKPDCAIHCDRCDKKFTNEKNLKSHLRVHSGERKYKCGTCEKSFAYLNVLKNHERAHAGIKKYVCHECGKKFVQLSNLNTHMLLHTGEKPHACELCDRKFGQPSEYKLHMLRHTGVKNFACNFCTLRFYTNANLQKHMGVHSDDRPYACKICDKRFKTRSYMAVHNRSHTGERPFACDYCPMRFASGKDKRNHRKTHTGEKPPSRAKKTKADGAPGLVQTLPESGQDDRLDSVVALAPATGHFVPRHDRAKDGFSLEGLKSNDKQSLDTFYQVPMDKTQCSYINPINPMY